MKTMPNRLMNWQLAIGETSLRDGSKFIPCSVAMVFLEHFLKLKLSCHQDIPLASQTTTSLSSSVSSNYIQSSSITTTYLW